MTRKFAPALLLALTGAFLPSGQAALGQAQGPFTPEGCLKLAPSGQVRLRGRLSVRVFPGPPNFESVKQGDAPERTYLLTLPKPICLDDGRDGFADPSARFDQVQVSTQNPDLWPRLRASLGRTVAVDGDGFAAFTGHHHAPLVVLADQVAPAEN